MPLSMKFYQDQFVTDGGTETPLPSAHRLVYVRHGAVVANDAELTTDTYAYFDTPLSLSAAADWAEVWRWELDAPNAAPACLTGTGVLTLPRLAHAVTTLPLEPESRWLFRLDQVTSAPGRVTPRHQHHGPGIRCLYQGTFNVQDSTHLTDNIVPGQPWWESGTETVIAWHTTQMPAIFVRGLVLPMEFKGVMSNIWHDVEPASQANWRLFIDQEITL